MCVAFGSQLTVPLYPRLPLDPSWYVKGWTWLSDDGDQVRGSRGSTLHVWG